MILFIPFENTSSKSAVIANKNSNDNTSAKSQNKDDISNGPASMDYPRNIQPTSSTPRTKILSEIKENKNIRTRMYDPNQTLEDFFADDDDGDIDQNGSNKSNNSYSVGRHHKFDHSVSDDDEDEDEDDEDEDDFYYDLTGSKIVAHDSSNKKKSRKTKLTGPKKENNMSTPTRIERMTMMTTKPSLLLHQKALKVESTKIIQLINLKINMRIWMIMMNQSSLKARTQIQTCHHIPTKAKVINILKTKEMKTLNQILHQFAPSISYT